jgi:L-iditol 2-dehydrogenase
VQVRVHAVGICGSDLHYYAEGGIGDTPNVYPAVLGHEPTGEIIKVGSGVTGWSKGDKAILEPAIYCYHCEFCATGHYNVCENLTFLSTPGTAGFFREFVNLPEKNLLPLPSGLTIEQATLFEPMAIVLHSIKLAQLKPGETAAVLGAGPIGLLTVAALKLLGAKRVWCVEPVAERRELARMMGADVVIDPRQVDPVKQILAETNKRGVDTALDCATKEDTVNQSIDVTCNAGRVVITGIPSEIQVKLNFHALRRREIGFFAVRRSNHDTEDGIKMLQEHPTKFAALVTHTRPIESIQPAFESLERYEDGVAKMVLTFPRP